ncbi:transporter substrate-binding domain-containing protein [Herbivorax sp. ANBcel31]|uniref:transporter substrate-binding domain-containing protein n=1 Tax=Herbivorax sp. ANBcel31 TaxID=3069754 RepID=UPI0027B48CD6|nr:transporter substrate-binding domain-containing protein [Herbivorax sp. ANBcel31]MDQ2087650.1 transporter substrate-binding domain-containing protein [Herbivorax sp. ANBcel31]
MKYNFKLTSIMLVIILTSFIFVGCGQEGIQVGVTTGTTYAEYVEENFSKVSNINTYDDDNGTLMDLDRGRIDAVVTDRLVGLNAITNAGYDNMKLAGEYLYEEIIGVAIRKGDDTLRQAINEALADMIADGAYAEISDKYFGRDVLEGIDYEETFPDEEPADDDSLQRVLDAGEISFAMSGGYAPFNYYDGDGELTGFDIDIGKEVANRLGVEYKPVTTDWDGIIEGLRSERYDGIFGSMAITERRLETVDFTDPYYYSGAQLIVLEDSDINGPEDLE